jgi:hypothetical protein
VVGGEEPLFAVLLLLFQPAKIRKPISSSSETPATQFHMPPTFSSRPLSSCNTTKLKIADRCVPNCLPGSPLARA